MKIQNMSSLDNEYIHRCIFTALNSWYMVIEQIDTGVINIKLVTMSSIKHVILSDKDTKEAALKQSLRGALYSTMQRLPMSQKQCDLFWSTKAQPASMWL